jgi:hypothetical protein
MENSIDTANTVQPSTLDFGTPSCPELRQLLTSLDPNTTSFYYGHEWYAGLHPTGVRMDATTDIARAQITRATPLTCVSNTSTTATPELARRRCTRRIPAQRTPHALVEQRSRKKLSDELFALGRVVPKSTFFALSGDIKDFFKTSRKGDLIDAAASHLQQLYNAYKTGQQDNVGLERRVREIEKLAGCQDCGVFNFVAGLRKSATPGKVLD